MCICYWSLLCYVALSVQFFNHLAEEVSERESWLLYFYWLYWLAAVLRLLVLCVSSLFFVFVALHPKSTAMVMAGRSVHLTTHFPGQT